MVDEVRQIILDYAEDYPCMGVSEGVPSDMRDGEVNAEGWVVWKAIPSHVSKEDLAAIETQYGFAFPPYFAAYLQACCQLLEQVPSHQYDGNHILMPYCPSDNPLGPLKNTMNAWRPLFAAGYVPFAQWNDGWGPMCLDLNAPAIDGDDPAGDFAADFEIVWFDHDELIPLGAEACSQREQIEKYAKPLYRSFKALFLDVFAQ
uniref:SMI1/KNR4 family protein n=1 Tax=Thaumasiovibrio occultus TaxID=1891184 RepID=UPI000B35FDF7|nr:SMI1/KNR4 family protein [Thaumasiovibrio occultus]